MSRGGADATVVREFDLDAKAFIEDGFTLPEAKTSALWMDEDRLLVSSALGGADFVTAAGYARTVRLWGRGTPFTAAPIIFEGEASDVYVYAAQSLDAPRPRTVFRRALDFINTEIFVEHTAGSRHRLEL